MKDIKWDIKKGSAIYRSIYTPRLKNWIVNGKIKKEEVLVWRSGLSGWRKPEELEELEPFFDEYKERKSTEQKEVVDVTKSKKEKIEKILIIDDESDIGWLLSKELEANGYNVQSANTGKDGVKYAGKENPDLIILDLKLSDISGEEVLEEIKKVCSESIIVIISAYGTPETKLKLKRKGAYCFIDKPFTVERLLLVIHNLTSK